MIASMFDICRYLLWTRHAINPAITIAGLLDDLHVGIKRLFLLLAFIVSAALSAGAEAEDMLPAGKVGTLEFSECQLSDALGRVVRKAECTYYSVPENYQDEQAKKINLFIVRYQARKKNAKPDAVLLIAGGPGQAASESFLWPNRIFGKVMSDRDVYLIDQRGTGRSNALTCEELNEPNINRKDKAQVLRLTRSCLAGLNSDPRFYTTTAAVKDFERVRRALAIPQWNIYGVSYGTRVAQHYLRRYPQSVRTLLLDAVVSPDLNLGPAAAVDRHAALQNLFKRCNESPACNKAFPGLESMTYAMLKGLKQRAVAVEFENFRTGKRESFELTHDDFLGYISVSLYSPEVVSLLPLHIYEAFAEKNYSPLVRQVIYMQEKMKNMLSGGMYNSVTCTEDEPFYREDNIKGYEQHPLLNGGFISLFKNICSVWPRGVMDGNLKETLVSDKPVLLMSGSADPITPPKYAERLEGSLSNSLHINLLNHGHGVAHVGCVPTILAKFIEQASVIGLSTKCTEKQLPDPFFVDFNGPGA